MWLQSLGGFALSILCTGEFGVVYRAKLLKKQRKCDPGFVAVKTMRGMLQLGGNQLCIIAGLVSTSNVRIQCKIFQRINFIGIVNG